MSRRFVGLVLVLLVASIAAALSGFVVVKPGELAVVRRLGKALSKPWSPGPHVRWPLGVDRVDKVRIDEVRQIAIGSSGIPGPEQEPSAGELLTGDQNLIRVRGVLQYHVDDPLAFIQSGDAVELSLERISEASLANALAHRTIDAALGQDRLAIAHEVEASLERAIKPYRLGVAVLGFHLTDARAPSEVQAEFDLAQSAKSRRDGMTEDAGAESAVRIASARAAARTNIDRARSAGNRKVKLAKAEAQRFHELIGSVLEHRALAIKSMYFDALTKILPRIKRKLVLSADEAIDLGVFATEGK